MPRYRIEIEQVTRGFVDIEVDPGDLLDVRAHAREAVEDGLLVPHWDPDDVQVSTCRLYDADAECHQQVGSTTAYCAVHQEPMIEGLDICWRRRDDLADQDDPAQGRMW